MTETPIKLPSYQVCRLCSLHFSDRCEDCLDDNLADFTPNQNIEFTSMPPFPTKEMLEVLPFEVRHALLALYVEKIVEFLR